MKSIKGLLNIVFLCSSLEPGRDGVGDYTRRFAAALIKAGHQCSIISLNDRYIDGIFNGTQNVDSVDVTVTRLSYKMPEKERFAMASEQINTTDPQWISLQFVPFGYHTKGLKTGLGKLLRPLGEGRQWHIMFHELWVGMAREETPKLRIWGRLQRYLIRSMVKALKPNLIHTQTPLYQQHLAKLGFKAGYLPLFGNIPVIEQREDPKSTKAGIRFVVFGAIHDRAPIEDLAKEAAAYAKENNKPVTLTIIGRGNSEQKRWATAWQGAGLKAELLGELPAAEVSVILSDATMGISATALAVIGKSGSYAAMREHHLPVLSVSKPWTPAGVDKQAIPGGVFAYRKGNLAECIANATFIPYHNNVSAVSVKFALDLKQAEAQYIQ